MEVVISFSRINELGRFLEGKQDKIVLVGGCFDVLHPGHVVFLRNAKAQGDILVVLLESDATVRKIKGDNRPLHNQKERAQILSALRFVDYVVLLPLMSDNGAYDAIVKTLRPAVIATTRPDSAVGHKKRCAKLVGAKLVYVNSIQPKHSSTKLIGYLQEAYDKR